MAIGHLGNSGNLAPKTKQENRKNREMTLFHRHHFVKLGASTVIGLLFCILNSGCVSSNTLTQEQIPNSNEKIIEEWMSGLMRRTRGPEGILHLSRFKEPVYFLTKPISWTPNEGQESYEKVFVPKGFVTDFASIPQNFWSLLRPDGEYTYAAIVHDYLYWEQPRPRNEADKIFKMAMQDFDIPSIKVELIYQAVRLSGQFAWNSNAKQRARGEKRILKRFPEDPRTQWKEWKKRPDVFVP